MSAAKLALLGLLVVAVGSLGATAARLLGRERQPPPPVTLTVEGHAATLPAGTTLAELAASFALKPRPGELLDVTGKPLRPDGEPGRLLVDGRAVAPGTRLSSGARVTVRGGADRREGRAHAVVPLRAGELGDPLFSLAATPGVLDVVRGAVSHELVSSRFRASGPARTPGTVALTFDDGPSPEYTPRILAELRRLGVHATFFVIGYLAQAYPALVREEAQAGMVVGNHSYNHPEVPPFGELPAALMRNEIALSADILTRIGVTPRLFRPPGGSFSPLLVRTAAALGERVVLWNVDPTDWAPGISARQVVRNVLSAVRAGSVVDMHDGGGDRSATLAALPAIVRGIRARGLRLVTLAAAEAPSQPSPAG